jgi:glucoamylase
MVGGSLGPSRVWFTLARGIVTEVYFPRIDIPQIKDLGFIVADGQGFWTEIKSGGRYSVSLAGEGIPAVRIRHEHERFLLDLRIVVSPHRDVLLLDYSLTGDESLRVYPLLSPRLGEDATDNRAGTARWHGRTVLHATQGPFALALAGTRQGGEELFRRASAGEVGESDGWQDFDRNGHMAWEYDGAGPGEVALMGEAGPSGTLALAFGSSWESAATLAFSALMEGFAWHWDRQVALWTAWQKALHIPPRLSKALVRCYRMSAMVLKVHEDKTFPGALIASLSVPWGEASGSMGGYHLVWSRDLAESAGAFLAMKETETVRRILAYLMATQQEDGHWLQNQWLGGKPFWQGIQLDEAAFPVLLAASLGDNFALDIQGLRSMIGRALCFIIREGPVTGQDRWEEDPGINLFTLAVSIAALVDGATFLDPGDREIALWIADTWNARLESWSWVSGTDLARRLGVPGYYLRAVPEEILEDIGAKERHLLIKNRGRDPDLPACDQISTDFLQLVRYGLRSMEDPHVRSSLLAVDRLLKRETPPGPGWYRYNGDGYGEHDDGSPFDGTGHGRLWPLLVGERGHAALTNGESSLPYLRAMAAMTGPAGLIPEQVWDGAPIPERDLWPGEPTGSAMPLVWAHAEFIKLANSHHLKRPVDRPSATWERYRGQRPEISWVLWRHRHKVRTVGEGQELRIVLPSEAVIHWGVDGWFAPSDTQTRPLGLGFTGAILPVAGLGQGRRILFTFYWPKEDRWEGADYEVRVVARSAPEPME